MYYKEEIREPIILDKEDYNAEQWKMLTKLFGNDKTERMELNLNSIERYDNNEGKNVVYAVEVLIVDDENDISSETVNVFSTEAAAINRARDIVANNLMYYNGNMCEEDKLKQNVKYFCTLDPDPEDVEEANFMTVTVYEMEVEK